MCSCPLLSPCPGASCAWNLFSLAAAVDDLVAAASEDRSTYAFTRVPNGRDEVVSSVEAAMAEQAEGRRLPFAIRWLTTDRVVGATRLMHLEYWQGPMPWPPGTRGAVRRADSRGADNTVRDTAFYSILNSAGPAVRDRLRTRLGLVEAA